MGRGLRRILDRNLANNFQDFSGSQIAGSLAIKDEFLNRLIADRLKRPAQTTLETPLAPHRTFDGSSLSNLLKKVAIRSTAGTTVVEFELKV